MKSFFPSYRLKRTDAKMSKGGKRAQGLVAFRSFLGAWLLLATLFSPLSLLIAAGNATDIDSRSAVIRQGVEETLQTPQGRDPAFDLHPVVSSLANKGLALLSLGGDSVKAEAFFRRVFAVQIMDKNSPDYGNVPFQINNPTARDTNAIEFTIWSFEAALIYYGDRLSPQFQSEALRHERAAIAAIRRHQVPLDYTNIWLMRTANLIALGRRTRDSSVSAEGQRALEAWLAYTRSNGITEYDSPTYSAVQLGCLLTIYSEAQDPRTKSEAKTALDYLWTDLAANYFSGTHSLTGPFSRTHDFLYQREAMGFFYFLEGFSTTLVGKDEFAGGLWLTPAIKSYHPSPSIRALAEIEERIVRQCCGNKPGEDRYNYITPDFAIGSTSARRGGQDIQVCVELASSKQLPLISLLPDNTDLPFGLGDDSHKNVHTTQHLGDAIAATQEKGSVLALLDLSPGLAKVESASVATNLIVPMLADGIFLDGNQVATGKPFTLPLNKDSLVCVREGKAVVAMRIFAADGCDHQQPVFALKYDGNQQGAGRVLVYHYRGVPKRFGATPVRAGVLLRAERCGTDEEFVDFVRRAKAWKIVEKTAGGSWSVAADLGDVRLAGALDIGKKQVLWRRVNDHDVPRDRLQINDHDFAAQILDHLH